jgi:hypothetical protein
MQCQVGTKVEWVSSNTRKTGEVIAVVPPGKLPIDLGYKRLDNSGLPRDHETYIVEARGPKYVTFGPTIQGAGPKRIYWPRVSLLKAVPEVSV